MKNCPWVGDLWVRSLLDLEHCRAPEKEISSYQNLFLTRVDGLRRRILFPGAKEEALNFSLIRETFQVRIYEEYRWFVAFVRLLGSFGAKFGKRSSYSSGLLGEPGCKWRR